MKKTVHMSDGSKIEISEEHFHHIRKSIAEVAKGFIVLTDCVINLNHIICII